MHSFKPWLAGIAMLAGVFCMGPAAAQDDGKAGKEDWYAGPFAGSLVTPDSLRDADDGLNLQLLVGTTLFDLLSVEVYAFHTETNRKSDTSLHDYLYGGGLDLALGEHEPGSPVFLVGGGALVQDILTVETKDFFGNVGLGFYLPFQFGSELWRLEGRYQLIGNDHPALGADETVKDTRVNLGVLFPFGFGGDEGEDEGAESASATPPPADSDGDGVADGFDQCPETRRWARADTTGCVPDSDSDGVDDARDACPDTPAGTPVDAAGCEARPAPAAAPLAPLDEDKDGVTDGADACPHTVPRFDVDDKGCVRPEDVTLRNVHFDLESSRLTADGYQLLRSLAATLNAEPALRLEVGGHADASGTARTNEALSRERAEVVRDFLTYVGIAEDRMTVRAYGASQPIGDNKTAEGRATNRRVAFRKLNNP